MLGSSANNHQSVNSQETPAFGSFDMHEAAVKQRKFDDLSLSIVSPPQYLARTVVSLYPFALDDSDLCRVLGYEKELHIYI